MFEIGNSLRDARLRRGIDLAEVEAKTKIRVKYLEALEDEEFDVLPAETYVKGFLRTYADFLGLEGRLYVEEYNSRFAAGDEPIAREPDSKPSRVRSSESNFVVVALAGIIAVTVLVVVAWQFGASGDSPQDEVDSLIASQPPEITPFDPPEPTVSPPEPTTEPRAESESVEPAPATQAAVAKLVLTAQRGPVWVSVRERSPTGELLYEGTLEQGQKQRFESERLWLQVGAAANLDVRLNGKKVKNFPNSEAVVVVTPRRVRTVSESE